MVRNDEVSGLSVQHDPGHSLRDKRRHVFHAKEHSSKYRVGGGRKFKFSTLKLPNDLVAPSLCFLKGEVFSLLSEGFLHSVRVCEAHHL